MGWVLEVAKMFMYISFPVGIFHFVNQPYYFEKYVIEAKKEHFPVESRQAREQMENLIYNYNSKIEQRRLELMEKQYGNK